MKGSCDAPVGCAGTDVGREKLCSLLLEIAGRDTNRLPSVRRHVAVLDAALPYMTSSQAAVARERIRRHEDKWGSLLPGSQNEPETGGIAPEERVYRWLSERRDRERLLRVMHLAACAIFEGETKLMRVLWAAYCREIDGVLSPVSVDTFREWLIVLRIARREAPAVYIPGSLCHWWVNDMSPAGGKGSAYADCLKRHRRRSRTTT